MSRSPSGPPKPHTGAPWEPTFFTVLGDYRSVVADGTIDLNIDPDVGPVTATVTFTPVLESGDAILASKADPRPTIYVPVPIVGHISADGRLKLRDAPSGVQENYEDPSTLPTAGVVGVAYTTLNDRRVYRWDGFTYIPDYNYTPIRLLADTALLELDGPLFYHVAFTDVLFNGEPGYLSPFTFAAPDVDMDLNIADVARRPGETAVGVVRVGPTGVRLNDAGEVVFSIGGRDIPDPLKLATVSVNGPAGPAGPPGPQGVPSALPPGLAFLTDLDTSSIADRDYADNEVTQLRGEVLSALTGLVHGVSVLAIVDDAPAAPPPAVGDGYIVSATPDPAGIFANHANAVASLTASGWTFVTPAARQSHLVEADNSMWSWNGKAWVKVGSVAKSSLAGDIHAAGPKSIPVDADEFVMADSEDNWTAKNITWAALIAVIEAGVAKATMTLENKSINLDTNVLLGTAAQFRTALTDATFGMLVPAPAAPTDPGNPGDWSIDADSLWLFRQGNTAGGGTQPDEWVKIAIGASAGLIHGASVRAIMVTVPATPTEGQSWIVGPGAPDDWAGHDNKIATWAKGAWSFSSPEAASTRIVEDQGALYVFDGTAWTRATRPKLIDLPDVEADAAVDGDVLSFNGISWQERTLKLDDLSDVDVVTKAPALSDVLQWDGTGWVPAPTAATGYTKPEVDAKITAATTVLDTQIRDLTVDVNAKETALNDRIDTVAVGMVHGNSMVAIASTPPTSPAEGQSWIIGPNPTGAWAGKPNQIAAWIHDAWAFLQPQNKSTHLVEDQAALYTFNGTAWVKVASTVAASGSTAQHGVGEIVPWALDTIPADYLECKGQTLAVATYADLYKVLGNKYNGGTSADGVSTFSLPDLRGYFLRGVGARGGESTAGVAQEDTTRLPRTAAFSVTASGNTNAAGQHRHGFDDNQPVVCANRRGHDLVAGTSGSAEGTFTPLWDGNHSHSVTVSGNVTGGDPETRPKNFGVRWVIRVTPINGGAPGPQGPPGPGLTMLPITRAAYDALATKDPSTLYLIKA